MTATEVVRHMLYERGVEWDGTEYTEPTKGHPTSTSLGSEYHDAVFIEDHDGNVLRLFDLTPEQAIAATLGTGTCHITVQDNMTETEGMGDVWLECDACGWQMPLEPSTPRFNYCPNCGRRVEQ